MWGILLGWPKGSRGLPQAPDDYGAWFYPRVATVLLLKAAARGRWTEGWKRKGWKTDSGKEVLNQDLWKALDNSRLSNVTLQYVKGHSGDPDNERVADIAVSFSKKIAIKLQGDH